MYSPFTIPIVAIIGAFVFGIVQTLAKSRVRELEVRERIAMIERGLAPPPEVDPRGFDRAMAAMELRKAFVERGTGRHRRAGITLMGRGIRSHGDDRILRVGTPGAAIGVGGFIRDHGRSLL